MKKRKWKNPLYDVVINNPVAKHDFNKGGAHPNKTLDVKKGRLRKPKHKKRYTADE